VSDVRGNTVRTVRIVRDQQNRIPRGNAHSDGPEKYRQNTARRSSDTARSNVPYEQDPLFSDDNTVRTDDTVSDTVSGRSRIGMPSREASGGSDGSDDGSSYTLGTEDEVFALAREVLGLDPPREDLPGAILRLQAPRAEAAAERGVVARWGELQDGPWLRHTTPEPRRGAA